MRSKMQSKTARHLPSTERIKSINSKFHLSVMKYRQTHPFLKSWDTGRCCNSRSLNNCLSHQWWVWKSESFNIACLNKSEIILNPVCLYLLPVRSKVMHVTACMLSNSENRCPVSKSQTLMTWEHLEAIKFPILHFTDKKKRRFLLNYNSCWGITQSPRCSWQPDEIPCRSRSKSQALRER